MSSYFQLSARPDGQFMFHLKTGNHEVLLRSQPYRSRQAARGGIESVRRNARLASRFVRMIEDESACYFVVLSDIGQIVGTSETYSSRTALEAGVKSVMTHGATTVIREPNTGPARDSSLRHHAPVGGTRTISHEG
jgi:uncharacterized protein YegP (UPF0339 family)